MAAEPPERPGGNRQADDAANRIIYGVAGYFGLNADDQRRLAEDPDWDVDESTWDGMYRTRNTNLQRYRLPLDPLPRLIEHNSIEGGVIVDLTPPVVDLTNELGRPYRHIGSDGAEYVSQRVPINGTNVPMYELWMTGMSTGETPVDTTMFDHDRFVSDAQTITDMLEDIEQVDEDDY